MLKKVVHLACGGNANKPGGTYIVESARRLPIHQLLSAKLDKDSGDQAVIGLTGDFSDFHSCIIASCESTDLSENHLRELSRVMGITAPGDLVIVSVGSIKQDQVQAYLMDGLWLPGRSLSGILTNPGNGSFAQISISEQPFAKGRSVTIVSTEEVPGTELDLEGPFAKEFMRNLGHALELRTRYQNFIISVKAMPA